MITTRMNTETEPIPEITSPLIDINTIQQNLTKLKTQMITSISEIQQQLRTLEKQNKVSSKVLSKVSNTDVDKKQKKITGFNICEKMSNELCDFMILPYSASCSRITITKHITDYIRSKKLDTNDTIELDEPLKLLFKLESTDEPVTYFNLQKYINRNIFEKN